MPARSSSSFVGAVAPLVAALLVFGCGGGSDGLAPPTGPAPGAPLVASSLVQDALLDGDAPVRFRLTVSDPDGDPVRLDLLNPPGGLVFHPLRDAASPAVAEVRWDVSVSAGHHHLRFRASDGTHRTDFTLRVRVRTARVTADQLHTVDLTGDGRPDVAAAASAADVDGVRDVGRVYVWTGADPPAAAPAVALEASVSEEGALLGSGVGTALATRNGLQLVDLVGDATPDVVALRARNLVAGQRDGAIEIWEGGHELRAEPRATLLVPDGTDDGLGLGGPGAGAAPLLADLDGDGRLDVLASAPLASETVPGAGAVYFWRNGGADFRGVVAPTATLVVPDANVDDRLGIAWDPQVQLADVTGDGRLDVVVAASRASVDGRFSAGAVYVWSGGPGLAGRVAPTATLAAAVPGINDALCHTAGFVVAEVTGDDVPDVLAVASGADVDGVPDTGAVFVWRGGAQLAGRVAPHARLLVPDAGPMDHLGLSSVAPQVLDLDSDGTPEVVAGTTARSFEGAPFVGAVYAWSTGAALAGDRTPDVTLRPRDATGFEGLGSGLYGYLQLTSSLRQVDLVGDARPDVLVAGTVDVPGGRKAACVYVFEAGELDGVTFPRAVLAGGWSPYVAQLEVADVTGDGRDDVLLGLPYERFDGVEDVGAVLVWAAGVEHAGLAAPTATLTGVEPRPQDFFVLLATADVTGDGVNDVLAGGQWIDAGGVRDAGAIYLWQGGPELLGRAEPLAGLMNPAARPEDALTSGPPANRLRVTDLDGDGILDLLAHTAFADGPGGLTDVGAFHVWRGGPNFRGPTPPSATLQIPGARAGDRLGQASGQSYRLEDVTGDGVLDLVAGAAFADTSPCVATVEVPDTGALFLWRGPLTDVVEPPTRLFVPCANAEDRLGF